MHGNGLVPLNKNIFENFYKNLRMTIKKTHYISGLTITIFIAIHLFNHFCSIFGADKHIEIMNVLRLFYRNIFIETILLIAIVVQIVSGLRLFKSNRKIAKYSFEQIHIWTGLYLAIFLIIHLIAVFYGRYFLHINTNYYFGVAALNSFPSILFFIPYYGLAIISFFGHIASVHSEKMGKSILNLSPNRQGIAIITLGCIFTIIIFYGLTNKFKGVIIPKEYQILIGK
jgi:hypothetical protein